MEPWALNTWTFSKPPVCRGPTAGRSLLGLTKVHRQSKDKYSPTYICGQLTRFGGSSCWVHVWLVRSVNFIPRQPKQNHDQEGTERTTQRETFKTGSKFTTTERNFLKRNHQIIEPNPDLHVSMWASFMIPQQKRFMCKLSRTNFRHFSILLL